MSTTQFIRCNYRSTLMRGDHYLTQATKFPSIPTTFSATAHRAWRLHHNHLSTWKFRNELLPRYLSSSCRHLQVFHVYTTILCRLFIRLQALVYKAFHTSQLLSKLATVVKSWCPPWSARIYNNVYLFHYASWLRERTPIYEKGYVRQ